MIDSESATQVLRTTITAQNRLLDHGRERSVTPVHAIAEPDPGFSWLGSACNPLRALAATFSYLTNGRRSKDQSESGSGPLIAEVDDEHLARLAAIQLLPPLKRRVGPAMDVHCLVMGCGRHGRSIAGEMLRRGCHVRLYDASPAILLAARSVIEAILFQHAREGLFADEDVPPMVTRLSLVAHPADALRGIGHVCIFEAVPEDVGIKTAVFRQAVSACIDANLGPSDVLMCSNTLSLNLDEIRAALPPAYAPCLVGARLLHPCWFVDDIDVMVPTLAPDDPHSSWTAVSTCSSFFAALDFKVSYVNPGQLDQAGNPPPRRRLLYEEAVLYAIRQKVRVEADAAQELESREGSPLGEDDTLPSDLLLQMIQDLSQGPSHNVHPPPQCEATLLPEGALATAGAAPGAAAGAAFYAAAAQPPGVAAVASLAPRAPGSSDDNMNDTL